MATIDGKGDRDLIQPAIDSTLVAAIEAACALPGIEEAFDGANIVSYEHVGCWADDEDSRAIEVMRQGLSDVQECLDFCVDDYEFFGVIDVRNSNLMCFCTNSEAEYQTYGESDICNNGDGGQEITVIKDTETRTRERIVEVAMDVYKITVESLSGGSDSDVEVDADIDVAMLGELQRDIAHLEPAWKALEKHIDEEDLIGLFGEPETIEDPDRVSELSSSNSSSSEEETSTSAIPSAMPFQEEGEEEEDIDVELLEVSQQNLEVVRVNDTRWSNKAKFENVWLLMGLLSIAIMICVAGAYRQWSP